jgi:hypothetical protein
VLFTLAIEYLRQIEMKSLKIFVNIIVECEVGVDEPEFIPDDGENNQEKQQNRVCNEFLHRFPISVVAVREPKSKM